MSLTAGSRLGSYQVLSLLGAGGMGEVYKARDTRLDREVALKVLPEDLFDDEERKARFEREAKLLAALNHPNIAAIHSFEEIPGSPGTPGSSARHLLVMELLEGETLRERLRDGALPVRKALEIAVQIARGLAAAHEKGIVHRDLKPENIFITKDQRVKILDFGLAKSRPRDEAIEKLTQAGTLSVLTEAGTVFGTANYMSPEQVRGEPADHRSDIFSFGTILFELLAGKNPFRAATTPETMTAILKQEPPALSEMTVGVAPSLSAIVGRCLDKKPEARFQSAADLAFALFSLSVPAAARAPRRRWMGVAALALVGGLALGLALARSLWSRGGSPAFPEFTRLTFRRGTVENARFAKDGKTILYSASWEGQPHRAFSTRPGEPEVPIGPPDALFLGVSNNGQLALAMRPRYLGWMYEGTLAISHGGSEAPREMATGVEEADWAPGDASMAIVRNDEERGKWILEHPIGASLLESPGRIGNARISPDGREVAFTSHPSVDPAGEVAVARRGEGPRTLSGDWRTLQGLAWSPSGGEILFTASREGRSQSLWAVSRSGRLRSVARWGGNWTLEDVAADGALLLTRGQVQLSIMALAPEQTRDLTWFDWSDPVDVTPDGRTVLFLEWGDGVGGAKVAFLRATDGSPAIRLGEGDPAAVSPDGRKALIYRSAPPRLVLVPAGPGQERTLPAGEIRRFGADRFPYSTAFFPGGTRFVFVAEAADELPRLWVQDVDGGPPQPFGPAERLSNPTISPDGGSVAAFAEATGRLAVFSANGEVRRSMDLGKEDSLPIGWFSDNRSVFLRVRVGTVTRIDRLDTVSGKREVWRDLPIQDPAGILSGVLACYISQDGKTIVTSYLRVLNDLYLVRNVR
jgi:Tol biopolymer transport system component/tRNA A-37 threonylcarbamoyl transferase component Bud32